MMNILNSTRLFPLLLMFGIAGSAGSAASDDRPNLRLGVVQSATGIAAEDGKTVLQALELAAEQLRAGGTEVELLIEDDQSTPKNSVSAYHSLRQRHVDAVIAATWDFTTNSLIPLIAKDRVVLFNTSVPAESVLIERSDGYAFVNAVSIDEEVEPFKRFLKEKKIKSLTVVCSRPSEIRRSGG